MKKCTIIGKTGVGKTVFLINFAEYLGMNTIEIERLNSDGTKDYEKINPKLALSKLADGKIHKTRNIQAVTVDIPMGKGKKKIQLIDTAGLIDGIHPDSDIRKAISQTLSAVRESDFIIHIIDASAAGKKELPNAMGVVDYQIAQFAQIRRGYVILANKMDLPGAKNGLKKIKEELSGHFIIPISALHKTGFKEVKTFVAHNI
ncbi:MAG TPA: GTP-binding protein [Thermoanaerobacterales bacterium]|nr:GTP-binding protein [Thermoanaerobacterales bacterium]